MWAMLGTVSKWILGGFAASWIASLGIGVVVYVGLDALLDATFAEVTTMLVGLPADLVQALAVMRAGEAISILTSAYSIRLSLMTFGGSFSKLRVGGGS